MILPIRPELLPEPDKLLNYRPAQLDTSFEPFLPADITARQERQLAIDDHELRVDDADGQEEYALHLQVDTLQFSRAWKTESLAPFGGRIGSALARLRMGEFLPDAGGGEANSYAGLAVLRRSEVPCRQFAEAIGDSVQGVGLRPVACDEEHFAFGALQSWEEGFKDAVACSEGYAMDVRGCEEAGWI
jgi:hypothetical protein